MDRGSVIRDDFRSATTGDACHCKNVSEELQIEYYD